MTTDNQKTILIPFILEHRTPYEGGKSKTHVMDFTNGNILCGIKAEQKQYSSGTAHDITLQWLLQPDPDGVLCLKCKNSAIKYFQ